MNRRQFMSAGGAVVVSMAIAGCGTDESSSESTDGSTTDKPTDNSEETKDAEKTPTATEATEDSESDGSDSSGSSGGSSSGYQIRVSYDGEWQGAINAGGSSRSVDGSGTETFDIRKEDPMTIGANAQKKDDSGAKLTVQILKDGDVVAEQSTTSEYGMAQATHSNF